MSNLTCRQRVSQSSYRAERPWLFTLYFWNDRQSLAQAILVAQSSRVSLSEIKRWSQTTNNLKEFKIFQEKLSGK
jgi:hypothetical protein